MVVCDQDVLSNFSPPTNWRYLENDQDREETVSLEKTFYRAAVKEWTQGKSLGNIKTESFTTHHKRRPNTVDPFPRTVHETNQTIALLSTSIEEEKLQSRKFEKYLESLVDGTDMDQIDIANITNLPPLSMSEQREEVSVVSQNSLWDSVSDPEVSVWRY
ncbi:uncharacterized protein LOC130047885 [Ostrea edulis]|uniref:uncharacterized protein LOC130047885 n=1 Tax=Ostrea edulis TaxID=37623 RepID=UPI0024AF3377|nr:uncharacterized protein LOC130047885 [Ostrea edulis]